MAGDASAYAALGLQPGAGRDAVDQAYRRLIKDYHPDRAGGDAARAAEINRAYRELRDNGRTGGGGAAPIDELVFEAPPWAPGRRPLGKPWLWVALALFAAASALVMIVARTPPPAARALTGSVQPAPLIAGRDPMRGPIGTADVDAGVRTALKLATVGDEMSMTDTSRACHDRLRASPSVALLDRCAAFDDAVVELQDRDPLRDRGRFSELAVTGRQWSAARGLSDDYVAIDNRLDQLRLQVELMVAGAGRPASG